VWLQEVAQSTTFPGESVRGRRPRFERITVDHNHLVAVPRECETGREPRDPAPKHRYAHRRDDTTVVGCSARIDKGFEAEAQNL
jgi:hypothetical protein